MRLEVGFPFQIDDRGRAQVVEDQVTYPLTTAMLTVPRSKVVRGFSFFGVSFVYIIFEDGTDIYWARSRVLEYLNAAAKRLPAGVTPALGPDATGSRLGLSIRGAGQEHVAGRGCARCRIGTFGLASSKAEGVAEVASVGGFVKQYDVVVDPGRLRTLGHSVGQKSATSFAGSNMDVGGRTLELLRTRVHGARPWLPQRHRRHRKYRREVGRRHPGIDERCGPR